MIATTRRRGNATLLALAFALVPACVSGIEEPLPGDEAAFDDQSGGGVAIDARRVGRAPTLSLPSARLDRAAFADDRVLGSLVGTTETLGPATTAGKRTFRESASWRLLSDGARGRLLAVRKAPSAGAPLRNADGALGGEARARLASWGVGGAEIGEVKLRRTMVQDREADGQLSAPQLHRYKAFVTRAIGGVPIEGHRAVLTYTPDGQLHRALVGWPALAAAGHRTRTSLTTQQIVGRARAALAAKGITTGQAVLEWRYVPQALPSGEVTIDLTAVALLPSRTLSDGTDEEARIVPVDVEAFE